MPLERVIGAGETLVSEQDLLVREQRAFLERNRHQAWKIGVLQVGLFAAFLFVWWFASGRLVDRLFVSDPVAVGEKKPEAKAKLARIRHRYSELNEIDFFGEALPRALAAT